MSEPEVPKPPNDSVGKGVGIGCLLHLVQIVLFVGLPMLVGLLYTLFGWRIPVNFLPSLIAFWGVTQLIYMLPAAWILRRKGMLESAKGILILVAIGVLLNGACDALLFRDMLYPRPSAYDRSTR